MEQSKQEMNDFFCVINGKHQQVTIARLSVTGTPLHYCAGIAVFVLCGYGYMQDHHDLGDATNTQTYTYKTTGWGDQLADVTYDAVGNPLTHNGYTLTWDRRQLKSMYNGYTNVQFTYNADGIRTSKTTWGIEHKYHLNGSQILAEEYGISLRIYLYDENGSPIGMQYRTTAYAADQYDTYYFEKNLQGDIIAVYTADGTKIGGYTYDAWGNLTCHYEADITSAERNIITSYNPFRYRGYYYDTETGLYYLQSRYYDPAMGRFLNADGFISTGTGLLGYNMYAYCNNNPVMYVDPAGNLLLEIIVVSVLLVGAGLTMSGCEPLTPEEQNIADNEYWGTSSYATAEEALEAGLTNMLGQTQKNGVEYFAYVYGEDGEYYISKLIPGDIDSVEPRIANDHYKTLRYMFHSHAISYSNKNDHVISEPDYSFLRKTRDRLNEIPYRKLFLYDPVPLYACDIDGNLFILPADARDMTAAYQISWEALP